MKALVVYDSFFGNTEKVAQAMGDALASQAQVQTLRVGDVRPEHVTGLDLLIVGSPTRAFSPSPAIKNWLKRELKPLMLDLLSEDTLTKRGYFKPKVVAKPDNDGSFRKAG